LTLRSSAKRLAHRAGVLDAFHRLGNRETLTVVMFHRVLPLDIQRQIQADARYTVTPELLADCLAFLQRNYAIVSLEDVLNSRRRIRQLPRRALLITFDDGWRDNLDWAMPVLQPTPWVLFLATDAIENPRSWWQEVLLWTIRTQRCETKDLARRVADDGTLCNGDLLELLLLYGRMSSETRRQILAQEEAELYRECLSNQILDVSDLQKLADNGVALCAHGASHLPMPQIPDAKGDMSRAKQHLAMIANGHDLPAMSLPHGRYDERVLGFARELGYELIFSSDANLNRCPGGWIEGSLLGRIPIATHDVADASGKLQTDRLAAWLFLRERRSANG
jgi:peptidoglycan/xylan/chitin deacetylase (PgdA/CDA1 family)